MEKECASRRVENEEMEIKIKVSAKEKIILVDDIEEALANSRDLKKNVDTLTKEQFEANKQQDYLKNENNDLKNNIIISSFSS